MENPVKEIEGVIQSLTQTPPSTQQGTILRYFSPSASFTHPFCRTGSFDYGPEHPRWNSRWLMCQIYLWYKIMSPRIEGTVHSVAFDETNLILYVSMSQVFRLFFLPGSTAPVSLTTVLRLKRRESDSKYLIISQEDLYQTSEFAKFVPLTFGLGGLLVVIWGYVATVQCAILAFMFRPVTLIEERWAQKKR